LASKPTGEAAAYAAEDLMNSSKINKESIRKVTNKMNPINKILLGIGIVVALAIAIVIVWLSLANAHLHTELAEANATATACEITNDDFRQKTEAQNQAIAQLKAASEVRERNAAAAVLAAQKTAAGFQADADRLARQKLSGDAGDDCKAATDLLNHYIAGAK
jgi:cell division protein FtsL